MITSSRQPARIPTGKGLLCAGLITLLTPCSASAQSISTAIANVRSNHDASRVVQQQIDALHTGRTGGSMTLADRELLAQLSAADQESKALAATIAQLEAKISAQNEANAGLIPLLTSMLNVLEQAIELGPPVDRRSRLATIATARTALTRHDLSATDRYARVLDTYRKELQFAYTGSIATTTIELHGKPRLVRQVRIGTIALYYVNPDATECGVWLGAEQRYADLPGADCATLASIQTSDQLSSYLQFLPLAGRQVK